GDHAYSPSTSPAFTQTVKFIDTTTRLSSSLNPSANGQSVTFTATIAPVASPPPGGTVTFTDGSSTLGTGSVDAGGHATFTTSNLSLGSHSITASYGGSSGYYAASSSQTFTQRVNPVATSTALAAPIPNPSTAGQQVTFTATVSPNPNAGTVTFTDGNATLGTSPVD